MAEETAQEVLDPNTTAAADMDVETGDESKQKRTREEESVEEKEDGVSKKLKVDEEKSVEEERLEKLETEGEGEEKEASAPVKLGFKEFGSSVEIFDYFYKFLHAWPLYVNVNKYEHKMLLELLKNGHQEPDKKIGQGVRAFQVRNHPAYKSKCFFVIREDDTVDDFSFRKCVDHILPLPEELHSKFDVKKPFGGGGGRHHGRGRGGRGGGRHGHGKGGRWRN
ncbi:hypothetical protein TanjilG_15797 [Lupinus angustifolius]|uniref:Uncharacterized protein n=1 Tax=Lupinus angustifolius TaxID=3871 RepID=A0A1J7H431_LUPAN|nr:PREDICTED: protein DCL, chloroplastic-like [Lupinus angustifolius]OIV97096.1 hypothetical protein TanjilG_15797 [Lupinus angustifolius]